MVRSFIHSLSLLSGIHLEPSGTLTLLAVVHSLVQETVSAYSLWGTCSRESKSMSSLGKKEGGRRARKAEDKWFPGEARTSGP